MHDTSFESSYVNKFYNPFHNNMQTKSTIIAGPMNISSVSLIVTGFPRQVIPLYAYQSKKQYIFFTFNK